MRVALAASLLRSISPQSPGGTEAFAYSLTEGLFKAGIDIKLFATSDSKTSVTPESICSSEQTNGVYEGPSDIRLAYQMLQSRNIVLRSNEFDVIHNNYFHFYVLTSLAKLTHLPLITTMHNDFWNYPNLKDILIKSHRKGKDMIVFASHAAKKGATDEFDSEVIYHGIDTSLFQFSPSAKDYVLWFSRIVPRKGIKEAIDAAKQGDFELLVAGDMPIRPEDKAVIEKEVLNNFTDKIKYVGSPSMTQRQELYQNAKAFLFPVLTDEQFGLVAAEAMACGTPVIAYNRGALAEVIEDGVTGFIIDPDNEDRPGKGSWIIKQQGTGGLIEAVRRVDEIDRAQCRKRVEKLFTREKMIDQYIDLYKRVINK